MIRFILSVEYPLSSPPEDELCNGLFSRLDIDVILFALLKLAERSRVRDVHLQQATRRVLRPGFIFWRVVGNGAHVDSAMRIVVSFLDKVTAELGTYGHGFSSAGFCRSCSISRIPANWLFAISIAASSG